MDPMDPMDPMRQLDLSMLPLEPVQEPEVGPETLTMAEQFKAFHRANPHVLEYVVRVARLLRQAGWRTSAIGLIFERLRWIYAVQTHGEDWKLNNNHRAFYARVAMLLCPDLDGMFALREQRAGWTPDWTALGIDPADPRWTTLVLSTEVASPLEPDEVADLRARLAAAEQQHALDVGARTRGEAELVAAALGASGDGQTLISALREVERLQARETELLTLLAAGSPPPPECLTRAAVEGAIARVLDLVRGWNARQDRPDRIEADFPLVAAPPRDVDGLDRLLADAVARAEQAEAELALCQAELALCQGDLASQTASRDMEVREARSEVREAQNATAEATQLAEERAAERNDLAEQIEGNLNGARTLRQRYGAREDETFGAFVDRLAAERDGMQLEVRRLTTEAHDLKAENDGLKSTNVWLRAAPSTGSLREAELEGRVRGMLDVLDRIAGSSPGRSHQG